MASREDTCRGGGLNRENGVAFRMQPMLQDGGKGTFALGTKVSISF